MKRYEIKTKDTTYNIVADSMEIDDNCAIFYTDKPELYGSSIVALVNINEIIIIREDD